MTNARTRAKLPDLLPRPTLELKAGEAPKHWALFSIPGDGGSHSHTLGIFHPNKTERAQESSYQKIALRRHVVE